MGQELISYHYLSCSCCSCSSSTSIVATSLRPLKG